METIRQIYQFFKNAGSSNHQETSSINMTHDNDKKIEDAFAAMHEVGPRVYNIYNYPEQIRIGLIGCDGQQNGISKEVAQKALTPLEPNLMIKLGDNFYPSGVSRPDDERFQTQFYNVYDKNELKNTPTLILNGNHDLDRDAHRFYREEVNHLVNCNVFSLPPREQLGSSQVAHTYLENPNKDYFKQSDLDFNDLPKYFMPYKFYSLLFGDTQLILLDSSNYAQDFLNLLEAKATKTKLAPDNQAEWLLATYLQAKENGKKIILAQHHPLGTSMGYHDFGKRAFKFTKDACYYLNPEQINQLNWILQFNSASDEFQYFLADLFGKHTGNLKSNLNENNYNQLISRIFKFQGFSFDLVCAAHNHYTGYINNQIIAGGGGESNLQDPLNYNAELKGCFIKEHGAFVLSFFPSNHQGFNVDVRTISGKHLKFSTDLEYPLMKEELSHQHKFLHETIYTCSRQYLKFLNAQQQTHQGGFFKLKNNMTHSLHDVNIMYDMINYLSQYITPAYDECCKYIINSLDAMKNKDSANSLYRNICQTLEITKADQLQSLHLEQLTSNKKIYSCQPF